MQVLSFIFHMNSLVRTVNGDLLYADVDMIVQQCNCITKSTLGLSQSIKNVLNVDPYGHRRLIKGRRNCAIKDDQGIPGTVKVYDRTMTVKGPRYVACLFAQFSPGKPGVYHQDQLSTITFAEVVTDSSKQRLIWFEQSLLELMQVLKTILEDPTYKDRKEPFKVAFPYLIGCGLAGGNWEDYKKAIESWTSSLSTSLISSLVEVLFIHKR